MKRAALVALSFALTLAGCGLKVPLTLVDGQTAVGDGVAVPQDPTGEGPVDTGVPGTDTGTTGGPAAGPTTGPGGNNGGPSGGSVPSSGLFEKETEGITKDTITICSHVPITGAAPIAHHPDRWGQFYFSYVNKELGGVNGRNVRFIAYDDQYYPAGARAAAEKCSREGAFIYLGAAGTDQIVSVARWAERKKVPYFHGPTSDKDMVGFKYNIHSAPTYEEQHRKLARYLVGRYGKNVDYGMVRVNSPYFTAGHDAYVDELKKLGVSLVVDRTVQKDENQFQDLYFELSSKGNKGAPGVDIVNNFTTPNLWLKMIAQKPSNYNPTWTAVSPIAGYNIVSKALGQNAKAVVFHHFNPACNCVEYNAGYDGSLPWKKDLDEFMRIFRKYSPEQNPPPDDFDYGAYQAAKALHVILLKLGKNPTRSALFDLLKRHKESQAETTPRCAADFTRGERRGGWRTNIFELKVGKWVQIDNCVDVES